jgi:hypothetical protein
MMRIPAEHVGRSSRVCLRSGTFDAQTFQRENVERSVLARTPTISRLLDSVYVQIDMMHPKRQRKTLNAQRKTLNAKPYRKSSTVPVLMTVRT